MPQFDAAPIQASSRIFQVMRIIDYGTANPRNIKYEPISDSRTQKYNSLTEKESEKLAGDLNKNLRSE